MSVAIENGFLNFIATYLPTHHMDKTKWPIGLNFCPMNRVEPILRVLWHSRVQDHASSYSSYITIQSWLLLFTHISFNNSSFLVQVLLSRLSFFKAKDISNSYSSGLHSYRKTAEAVMCGLLPDSPTATKSRTDGNILLECYIIGYSLIFLFFFSPCHIPFFTSLHLVSKCQVPSARVLYIRGSKMDQMFATLPLMSSQLSALLEPIMVMRVQQYSTASPSLKSKLLGNLSVSN